jgi:hypothetical protein
MIRGANDDQGIVLRGPCGAGFAVSKAKTLAITSGVWLAITPATALQFPGTCITPPATVTRMTGIDTRDARMEARYTLPDIIQACHEGYLSPGTLSIDDCIRRYRLLTDWPPLHATADCVVGLGNVEGERTVLPAHADCATGGFRAIAAFKTLCPSYGGEVLGE